MSSLGVVLLSVYDAQFLFQALCAVSLAHFPLACGDILPILNTQLQFEVLAAHVHEPAWKPDGPDSEPATSAGRLQEVEAAVRSTGFTGELRAAKLYDVYSSGSEVERRLGLQGLIQVWYGTRHNCQVTLHTIP